MELKTEHSKLKTFLAGLGLLCVATVNAALTSNVIAPPVTNLLLAWNPPPVYLQVFSSTNLTGPWTLTTNLYTAWPTNFTVPNSQPAQYFRLAIKSDTNLFSFGSVITH